MEVSIVVLVVVVVVVVVAEEVVVVVVVVVVVESMHIIEDAVCETYKELVTGTSTIRYV